MPQRVTRETFEEKVLQADKPVLVDFYSDSCVPCKRIKPLLSELEEIYADKLDIVTVNVNYDRELAQVYEVQAVPTLIVFNDGNETDRMRGVVNRRQLVEVIEPL